MADPNAVKRAKKYAARRAELLLKFLSTKAAIDEANAEADLSGANLWLTSLGGADLRNAKLVKAHLVQCNLGYADLRGADLSGANLENAMFLDTANVTKAKFKNAVMPDGTKSK